MTRKYHYITESYTLNNGFNLDVIDDNQNYEAWIWHKDYGHKCLCFGMSKHDITKDEFMKMLTPKQLKKYAVIYAENYMEELA